MNDTLDPVRPQPSSSGKSSACSFLSLCYCDLTTAPAPNQYLSTWPALLLTFVAPLL